MHKIFMSLFGLLLTVSIIGTLTQKVDAQTGSQATGSEANASMVRAGMTPGSPFYFLEQLAESIGGIFTPRQGRAQRFLRLAEERLAEASITASSSDTVQKAITRFRQQQKKAFQAASSSQQSAILARVASSTTKHFSVLDRVQSQVPQQAKDAIRQAKQASTQGHLSALNALARRKPGQAAEIAMQAAEGRLQAAKKEAKGKGGIQDVQSSVQTYQQYTQFGRQISKLAQGIESGTSSPQDIVNQATKRHRKILQSIQKQVPQEAQAGIRKALEQSIGTSSPQDENLPSREPAPQQRLENKRQPAGVQQSRNLAQPPTAANTSSQPASSSSPGPAAKTTSGNSTSQPASGSASTQNNGPTPNASVRSAGGPQQRSGPNSGPGVSY